MLLFLCIFVFLLIFLFVFCCFAGIYAFLFVVFLLGLIIIEVTLTVEHLFVSVIVIGLSPTYLGHCGMIAFLSLSCVVCVCMCMCMCVSPRMGWSWARSSTARHRGAHQDRGCKRQSGQVQGTFSSYTSLDHTNSAHSPTWCVLAHSLSTYHMFHVTCDSVQLVGIWHQHERSI